MSRTRSEPIWVSMSIELNFDRAGAPAACRLATRSTAMKPALWREPRYSLPGLPRPTINFICSLSGIHRRGAEDAEEGGRQGDPEPKLLNRRLVSANSAPLR